MLHCIAQVTVQQKLMMPVQPGRPLTLCCALQLAGVGLLPFDLPKQDILLLVRPACSMFKACLQAAAKSCLCWASIIH